MTYMYNFMIQNWKINKDEKLMKKIQEKERQEEEDLVKIMMSSKVNKKSESIVKKRVEKVIEDEKCEEFDLWPVDMKTHYFDK